MNKVYPIVIKFNSKNVQIGSAKVDISSGCVINRGEQEHDVILKELNIQFNKDDWLTKLLSVWS